MMPHHRISQATHLVSLMRIRPLIAISLASLFFVLLSSSRAQQKPPGPAPSNVQSVELSRLEVTEQLSESLANQLLDLSIAVRDRNLERTSRFFAASLDSRPFPPQPSTLKMDVKWIGSHGWTPRGAATPPPITRDEFLGGFFVFL